MSILGMLKRERVVLHGDEARIAIGALRRSAAAMPEATETLGVREMRAKRETNLAQRIALHIGRDV